MQHNGFAHEWAVIKMKNGKFLFLSSEKAVSFLRQQYDISEDNVADMRSVAEEMIIDGKRGLGKFTHLLDNIQDLDNHIIIHCKMGLNRTPVAAAIFLVEKMSYHPDQAKYAVETALRTRKDDYTLNELGLYDAVLEEVAIGYQHRKEPRFFAQPKCHAREVKEINQQKQAWYG